MLLDVVYLICILGKKCSGVESESQIPHEDFHSQVMKWWMVVKYLQKDSERMHQSDFYDFV